jgi:hypothetical protein
LLKGIGISEPNNHCLDFSKAVLGELAWAWVGTAECESYSSCNLFIFHYLSPPNPHPPPKCTLPWHSIVVGGLHPIQRAGESKAETTIYLLGKQQESHRHQTSLIIPIPGRTYDFGTLSPENLGAIPVRQTHQRSMTLSEEPFSLIRLNRLSLYLPRNGIPVRPRIPQIRSHPKFPLQTVNLVTIPRQRPIR